VGWALVYPCARDNSTYRESAVGSLNNWTQRSNPDNDITELHNQNAKPSHPWNSKATVPTNTLGIGAQNAGGNIPQKYRLQETSPPFPSTLSQTLLARKPSPLFSPLPLTNLQSHADIRPTPPHPAGQSENNQPANWITFFSFRRCSPFSDHPHH